MTTERGRSCGAWLPASDPIVAQIMASSPHQPSRAAAPSAAASASVFASASAPGSNGLSLPVAAQPDVVLAWEKDGFYAKQIHQQLKVIEERSIIRHPQEIACMRACHTPAQPHPHTRHPPHPIQEVAEALMGARRVELLGPEVEALGDLLYYGLTVLGGGWAPCSSCTLRFQPTTPNDPLPQLLIKAWKRWARSTATSCSWRSAGAWLGAIASCPSPGCGGPSWWGPRSCATTCPRCVVRGGVM